MTTELNPSKLGTKDHWDNVYSEELSNFQQFGDEGEVWFGEESVEKMVEWALEHHPPSQSSHILEVGSGNGTLLFALADAGYPSSKLCGIDYSSDAVRLARSIAKARGEATEGIAFQELDFLKEQPVGLPSVAHGDGRGDDGGVKWDLVMDKGTFDAMALMTKDADGCAPADAYPTRISGILKEGGQFLITSCNFTEDELRTKFETPETGLIYHSRIQHPTFTFGGKSGSVVSSVAFTKVSHSESRNEM